MFRALGLESDKSIISLIIRNTDAEKIKHKLAFYNFRKWCESDSLFYKNYNYIQYSKCIDLIKLSKVNENLELSEIEKKFVITNR